MVTPPVPDMLAWQREVDARLAALIRHASTHAPAVRVALDGAGVAPEEIREVADLARIPVTSKDQLVRLQAADPPFGGFCTRPLTELGHVYVSPGPLYEPEADGEAPGGRWLGELLRAWGLRAGAVAVNAFSYHLVPAGRGVERVLRSLGLTVVPTGVGNSALQARVARDLGAEVFCGTPSFLWALLERMAEQGATFRYAVVGAEAFPAELRRLVVARGVTPIRVYGTADVGIVACACPAGEGMHVSDDMAVEVVEPATGRPLAGSEVGEVVVTSFNPVYPLVRLGTGDLSRFVEGPCPCGRPAPRLAGVLGRVGAAVKVRGMFLYPHQVDDALAGVDGVAGYRAVVGRSGHRDRLVVEIEVHGGSAGGEDPSTRLGRRLEAWPMRVDRVEAVPPGTLPAGGPVLVDERPPDG